MSELTPNLGLFKYSTDLDGKQVFSIDTALNDNWDILDEKIETKADQDSLILKADQDLGNISEDNVSQNFKDMSIGWGMPDYNAGVSKAIHTTYQAEEDGIFVAQNAYNGGTIVYMYVSDDSDFSTGLYQIANYLSSAGIATTSTCWFPVSKGQYYKVTDNASTSGGSYFKATFYPLKGAN